MEKKDNTADTIGKDLLKNFELIIKYSKSINIDLNEIYKYKKKNMIGNIEFHHDSSVYHIEFPVNHINFFKNKFQIETGPILFPNILKDNESFNYLPTFIHFNNDYKIDIIYDYPTMLRTKKHIHKGILKNIRCKIDLFIKQKKL